MTINVSKVGLALLWCAQLLLSSAHAQSDEIGERTSAPATISARAVTGNAPVVDGDVLADPAWTGAPYATDFIQSAPNEGAPSSERTEVRVLFTEDTLYLSLIHI